MLVQDLLWIAAMVGLCLAGFVYIRLAERA
jgi:hypothetical protein